MGVGLPLPNDVFGASGHGRDGFGRVLRMVRRT